MILLPAIDLRRGRVVRLAQGEATRQTIYPLDPAAQAEAFIAEGATWLHVVDLDRALGEGDNLPVLRSIVSEVGSRARIQAGGGYRSLDAIDAALDAGVTRVVIGTAAITTPALLPEAVRRAGAERLAAGIDARDGVVAIRGWTESTGVTVAEAAQRIAGAGIEIIVYTDITRDGMLSGPDLPGCRTLIEQGADVIASGGFARLADVTAARDAGCRGAILGRSLYERTISLGEAVWEAARPASA